MNTNHIHIAVKVSAKQLPTRRIHALFHLQCDRFVPIVRGKVVLSVLILQSETYVADKQIKL